MKDKTEEMSELKPCPFCGSKDASLIGGDHADGNFWVHCDVCAAEGPVSDDDALEAMDSWNKAIRPLPPSPEKICPHQKHEGDMCEVCVPPSGAASEATVKTDIRTCNRHYDCEAAEKKATEDRGLTSFYGFHCHDDECEECFGN